MQFDQGRYPLYKSKKCFNWSQGLYPFMYSSHTKSWTQDGMANATFMEKRLRYPFLYDKLKINTFYELSFEVESNG